LPAKPDATAGAAHQNIRGPQYYQDDKGEPGC
jgi:hypothetical protein